MALCEVTPVTLSGAQTALKMGCPGQMVEVPFSSMNLKKAAKKDEVTGSTSVTGGKVWDEYASGSSGGSFDFSSQWRPTALVQPPMIRQGATYRVEAYVRRPGWNNAADLGSAYVFNAIIDSNDLTFDPKRGFLDWKVSGTATGEMTDPA